MKEIDRPDLERFRRQSVKIPANKTIVNNLLTRDQEEEEEEVSLPYPLPPTDDDFLKSFIIGDVDFKGQSEAALNLQQLQDAHFDNCYTAVASAPASPWVSAVGVSNIHSIKDKFLINDKWIEDPQQEAVLHYSSLRSPNPSYCNSTDIIVPLAKNIVALTRDGFCQRKWPYPYSDSISIRVDPRPAESVAANDNTIIKDVNGIEADVHLAEGVKEAAEPHPKKRDDYRYKPQEISIAVSSYDGRLLLLGSTVYGIEVDPNPNNDIDADADVDGLNAMVGCCSIHDSVDGRLVVMLSQEVRGGVIAGAFNNANNKVVVLGGGQLRSLHVFTW